MSTTLQSLDRPLGPFRRSMSVDTARALAELDIDPEVQARLNILASLCAEGRLTAEERAEYGGYVEAIDLMDLIRLKARRLLDEHGPA